MPTILLVESDPGVSRVMARLLEAEGFTVLAASGAREALTLLYRNRQAVRLVAVEWEPPDMAGLEFVAAIARVAPAAAILRLAGGRLPWAPDGDRRADPLVAAKPFRADELVRHVRAALGLSPRDRAERRLAWREGA